jgi:transposase-like protein
MSSESDDALVEPTDGWRDLVAWLEGEPHEGERKRSPSSLAATLGISQPAVRGWVKRFSRPTEGALRDAVCRLVGSKPERWETTEERSRREQLEAAVPTAAGQN